MLFLFLPLDKLGNEDAEKVSVASDVESVITYYCKSRGVNYHSDCGLVDVLQPMLALKWNKASLYNSFYSFVSKFVPR